jgi:hypothetical protein
MRRKGGGFEWRRQVNPKVRLPIGSVAIKSFCNGASMRQKIAPNGSGIRECRFKLLYGDMREKIGGAG